MQGANFFQHGTLVSCCRLLLRNFFYRKQTKFGNSYRKHHKQMLICIQLFLFYIWNCVHVYFWIKFNVYKEFQKNIIMSILFLANWVMTVIWICPFHSLFYCLSCFHVLLLLLYSTGTYKHWALLPHSCILAYDITFAYNYSYVSTSMLVVEQHAHDYVRNNSRELLPCMLLCTTICLSNHEGDTLSYFTDQWDEFVYKTTYMLHTNSEINFCWSNLPILFANRIISKIYISTMWQSQAYMCS